MPQFVPALALTALQSTSALLAWNSPTDYVTWLLALGWGLGLITLMVPRSLFLRGLTLGLWSLAVQLILLAPGQSPGFVILIVAPVMAITVLKLPSFWGPVAAVAQLATFVAGQGPRLAWGVAIPATEQSTLFSLAVMGLVLIGGTWALRSSLERQAALRVELAHLKDGLQQMVQANVGFQELANAVEQSSSRRERLRITREIHDIVGYTLTNQTMVLQAASVLLDKDHDKLRGLLESAQEAARNGLQDVRQALRRLRLDAERPVPFLNRLHQLCRTFEQATQVKVDLSGAQTPDNLPDELELVLYRVVQEGLTNAFLHGKASRVTVGLAVNETELTLHISDNGQTAAEFVEGIGLTGMRERLEVFGGTLSYQGGETGFTLWVQIPRQFLETAP